jgi:hypothetical protein
VNSWNTALPWTVYEQGIAVAFSADKRVIADVAIFAIRGRRQTSVTRRRHADMAIIITTGREGYLIGFPHDVPPGQVIIASHDGRCEYGRSDHSCRQELDYGH